MNDPIKLIIDKDKQSALNGTLKFFGIDRRVKVSKEFKMTDAIIKMMQYTVTNVNFVHSTGDVTSSNVLFMVLNEFLNAFF